MFKILIPILSLAAAIGLYFVHIEPTLADIKIIKERESEFDEALEKARQLEDIKERLSTQILSFGEEELETLEKFLPSAVDNVHLIFDVNSIAEQYGTSLISAEVAVEKVTQRRSGDTTLEKPYQTVIFTFSVNMDYKKFLEFISDLERSIRLMDVSRIHFSTGIDAQGFDLGRNVIEVQFNTYSSN